KVHCKLAGGKMLEEKTGSRFDIFWTRRADGISDRDFIHAEIEQRPCHIRNLLFSYGALIWADEAGRDITSARYPFFQGSGDDGPEAIDRFLNSHIDVLAIEGFRSGREYCDATYAACKSALQPFHVRHERRIADVRSEFELLNQFLSVG